MEQSLLPVSSALLRRTSSEQVEIRSGDLCSEADHMAVAQAQGFLGWI
jgi:hypothetical protein